MTRVGQSGRGSGGCSVGKKQRGGVREIDVLIVWQGGFRLDIGFKFCFPELKQK